MSWSPFPGPESPGLSLAATATVISFSVKVTHLGAWRGQRRKWKGNSSLAARASARGQRKGACHPQAFCARHGPPADPGLLGISQLHTAYGAPWHPQKLSLQPALTMECPTAERNRGGKIPGKGNGHKLPFHFNRDPPRSYVKMSHAACSLSAG